MRVHTHTHPLLSLLKAMYFRWLNDEKILQEMKKQLATELLCVDAEHWI